MANGYTHLKSGTTAFSDMMLSNNFGVITVMNVDVFESSSIAANPEAWNTMTAADVVNACVTGKRICRIDTLKVANVNIEGPSKTITGGQYSNPLIKYGKTARLEMQDALGDSIVLEALAGGLNEWGTNAVTGTDGLASDSYPTNKTLNAFHYGSDFSSTKTLIGDTFFIDRKTGKQVKVKIVFYQFVPDSIFNLTQDAEGDATVFDLNGDLLATDIQIPDDKGSTTATHGVFYSIVAAE